MLNEKTENKYVAVKMFWSSAYAGEILLIGINRNGKIINECESILDYQ